MATVKEEKRSVKLLDDGSTTVERRLRIHADSSHTVAQTYQYALDLAETLVGGTKAVAGGDVRGSPYYDPYFRYSFVKEVEILGDGESKFNTAATPSGTKMVTSKSYYENPLLIVRYSTGDQQRQTGSGPGTDHEEEIELASEQWDFGAQNLTLKGEASFTRFESQGQREPLANEDTQPAKTIPRVDYMLTRNYVINLPRAAISQLLGKVNEAEFGKNIYKFAVETLRFDSATISRRIMAKTGAELFRVTYKFAYIPIYEWRYVQGTPLVVVDQKRPNGAVDIGFVGWNRIYRQRCDWWEKPRFIFDASVTPTGHVGLMYMYDTLVSQNIRGTAITGFNLLFHPAAT